MSECVVAFKLHTGEELLGILVGVVDGIVKIEHPYYTNVNALSGTVVMSPYCSLTDETYFEFKEDKLDYLVTAREDVSRRFLNTVDDVEYRKVMASVNAKMEEIEQESVVDEIEAMLANKTYLQGNSTKH